jgi:hypothetical protein
MPAKAGIHDVNPRKPPGLLQKPGGFFISDALQHRKAAKTRAERELRPKCGYAQQTGLMFDRNEHTMNSSNGRPRLDSNNG